MGVDWALGAALKHFIDSGMGDVMNAEQESDMKAGKANPSNPNECFGLCFQVALLEALKAPTTEGLTVQIVRKINGGDVDWALGAALKHFIDSGMGDVMKAGNDPSSVILRALAV